MTNVKTSKRALLCSVVALLLCFAMLLGTTYAWFTDSASSGSNVITSGNLDIVVKYTLDGTNWNDLDGADDLFQKGLWEPGHTEVVALKIVNVGSLALTYSANMNVVSETNGKTKDDANIKLSDYLVVNSLITTSDADIAAAFASDSELVGGTADTSFLSSNILATCDTILRTNEFKYIIIKVDMPETVGNEANHNGTNVPSIEFGVNVYATQFTYETDSFDDQYDAGLAPEAAYVKITLNDGSVAAYYDEDSSYAGRVRLLEIPENLGTEYVVPAEVNDLGGALAGVTLDKLTIGADVVYGYKSLNGATIDEVVLEDGATTVPDRLFYMANVDTVVLPDSVTTIENDAFQRAEITEIIIPASVNFVGTQAFGSSKIEKVIFEGNTTIENKAFRGCANLRTVYINGDDITFVNTTGEGNCWFCNGESNNPNTSDITFYVKNDAVAAKVLTAMGAEANNTTVIVQP